MKNKIIGLYGMMCSGKDTVAAEFEVNGYKKLSMSDDVLRPILLRLKLKPDRLNYIKLSKALKNIDPSVLAFLAHKLMNKGEGHKYIIPNFMSFQEARFFKQQSDIKFKLFRVNAYLKTRYERNLKRKSEKDVTDFAKFQRQDKLNLANTGLKGLMHAGLEDEVIENNGTLEELKTKIKELMEKYDL